MGTLCLKLLFPELILEVGDLLPSCREFLAFIVNLASELGDLLVKALLIGHSLVLEVFDDVELVLF